MLKIAVMVLVYCWPAGIWIRTLAAAAVPLGDRALSVTFAAVAAVFTITLWLRLVGATASGWLGDRMGRKTPLMISILWYSICNFIAGFSPTFAFLFFFLGAQPCTEWLDDAVARAADGFILTGAAAGADNLLETSVPGIFAAGDVRSGSTKRCSAAVGEGSMAVQFVHEHLAAAAARVRTQN